MKKLWLFLCLTMLTLTFCGCESEFRVVKMEIGQLPNRLVYVANVDTELSLEGGTVIWTDRMGNIGENPMTEYGATSTSWIQHNINFDVPGIYTVEIHIIKYPQCSYQVMVISQEEAQLLGAMISNHE